MRLAILALFFCSPLASRAPADELVFRNGDRISGKILTAADGKMTVDSAPAGKVVVSMSDLKTFATDGPIAIHFKDGTVLNQRIVAVAEDGRFGIEAGQTLQAQTFSIADIAKINPPPVKWTGSIAGGLAVSRGNSVSQTGTIDVNASRRTDEDRITFGGGYVGARQDDPVTGATSTTKRYEFGSLQYDYFFTPALYGYGNANVEKDAIALIDLRLTTGIGGGYQVFDRGDLGLAVEAGVSWLSENYAGATPTNDTLAGRAAYKFFWNPSDRVKLFHDAEWYESFEDFEDQYAKATAGVRSSLTDSMFTEFKVLWTWDSTPAIGKERTDVLYIASVGWSF